jgi:hypothetical protein
MILELTHVTDLGVSSQLNAKEDKTLVYGERLISREPVDGGIEGDSGSNPNIRTETISLKFQGKK